MDYSKRLKKSLRFDRAKEKKAKSQSFNIICPKKTILEKMPRKRIKRGRFYLASCIHDKILITPSLQFFDIGIDKRIPRFYIHLAS